MGRTKINRNAFYNSIILNAQRNIKLSLQSLAEDNKLDNRTYQGLTKFWQQHHDKYNITINIELKQEYQ